VLDCVRVGVECCDGSAAVATACDVVPLIGTPSARTASLAARLPANGLNDVLLVRGTSTAGERSDRCPGRRAVKGAAAAPSETRLALDGPELECTR
jgi:hypothetical protein